MKLLVTVWHVLHDETGHVNFKLDVRSPSTTDSHDAPPMVRLLSLWQIDLVYKLISCPERPWKSV